MTDDRLKHLEFIQATVARMNTVSFLVKGWSLTLTAALLALAADRHSALTACGGILASAAFWAQDCEYLRQERLFRRLYDDVRRADSPVEPLSMDVSAYLAEVPWRRVARSRTLVTFYGCAALASALASAVIAVRP